MTNESSPSAEVYREGEGPRVEILWYMADKVTGEHVDRWIPGMLLGRRPSGRCHVAADNGWVCFDAHPKCVREIAP